MLRNRRPFHQQHQEDVRGRHIVYSIQWPFTWTHPNPLCCSSGMLNEHGSVRFVSPPTPSTSRTKTARNTDRTSSMLYICRDLRRRHNDFRNLSRRPPHNRGRHPPLRTDVWGPSQPTEVPSSRCRKLQHVRDRPWDRLPSIP